MLDGLLNQDKGLRNSCTIKATHAHRGGVACSLMLSHGPHGASDSPVDAVPYLSLA